MNSQVSSLVCHCRYRFFDLGITCVLEYRYLFSPEIWTTVTITEKLILGWKFGNTFRGHSIKKTDNNTKNVWKPFAKHRTNHLIGPPQFEWKHSEPLWTTKAKALCTTIQSPFKAVSKR
eukprot:5763583-Amphidinium_carterae.1